MSWWSRLTNVTRTARVDDDLEAELQFHREERIRELIDEGLSRDDATAAVARRFGNPLRWREQSRDIKLLPWLDSLLRDVRHGARMLRKNALVTSAAVLSLSLALGACVAAFSLVDALILRQLPVRQPGQLIYVAFPSGSGDGSEVDTFNDPTFVRLRDAGRGHADLFAMSTQVIRRVIFADAAGEKEPVRTQYISGDAFERLGIGSMVGRLIASEDDRQPGASPVAVVSYAYWMRRFGGDPSVVGRWFTLDERPFQIVGVSEPDFQGIEPGRPTDVWMPYAMYNPRAFGNPAFNWFRIFGRLNQGVRPEQAQSVLHAAFAAARRDFVGHLYSPQQTRETARYLNTPLYVRSAATGPSPLRQQFERPLLILAAIAALILLIAGSNVANLFLARTAAREHEMSLRLSIGAGRGRLIQQMLVESTLVAAAASALGLIFAAVAAPAVVGMLGVSDDPVQLTLPMNWRLIAVAGALTLTTTALFGVAPAVRASAAAPMIALKTGTRSTRAGVMRLFIVAQVAFGLAVLFVGGLLVLSFGRLSSVNPGFAASNVLLLSLETTRRAEPDQQREALVQALDRLRHVPGVQSVASAEFNALGRAWTHYFRVPGKQYETFEATVQPVTPGYFETMQIPLMAGRTFFDRELTSSSSAIVVNDAFVTQYYGREPAVGRALETRFADSGDSGSHEILGVVANTRYDLRRPAAPIIYIPLSRRNAGTIHVRIADSRAAAVETLSGRLREEVHAANPLLRVLSIRSQATVVSRTLARERLLALLSGFFAVVGLVLAAVGLYGVLSYSVVQRTREIGIRVALGAQPAAVVRMVVADVTIAAVGGALVGLAGGLYLSRFVDALLFEVRPLDFWSLTLPLGLLLCAAIAAATIPALRATRVDPVIALRYE
jgi:putative ABC transport system permease protein